MLLVVVSILVVALAYRFVAPRLAPAGDEQRAKGLDVIQTFLTLCGIVLLAEWFLIDRPDAERLKFDHKVQAMPLDGDRALLVSEVTIANVGNHAAEFDDAPYALFVQQVTPVDPKSDVSKDLAARGTPSLPSVTPAQNWKALAYGAGRAPYGPYARTDERGLTAEILPGEEDTIYFRTAVPCSDDLHVSVSARFSKDRSLVQRLARTRVTSIFPPKVEPPRPLMWIKQTFVDLSDVCTKKEPNMKGPLIAAAAALLTVAASEARAAQAHPSQPGQSTTTTTTTHTEEKESEPKAKPRAKPAPAQSSTSSTTTTTTTTGGARGSPPPETSARGAADSNSDRSAPAPAVQDPGAPPPPPTTPRA